MAPPTTLWVRDIGSDVDGVKNTFSSWDACMAESYCKYPVIAAIVIVSLIVLSVLFCVVRCACCGLECCCGCLSCCNACCPSPRGKKRGKFADEPSWGGQHGGANAGYGGGYQPTAPPMYNPSAQYAQFDVSKPVHADSLPAMPSWDTAASRKVLDESQAHHEAEAVEMDHMHPAHGMDEQAAPMLAHQAPAPSNGPHNPDAFVAAAPSPYDHHAADPYSHQDHSDPLQRYGGVAAQSSNRLSTGAGGQQYSRQSSYSGVGGPTAYGTTSPTAPAAAYSHRSPSPYGGAASSSNLSSNAGYYGHATSPNPQRAMSPPHRAMSPPADSAYLPGALQAGGRAQPPQQSSGAGAYQPYSAYSPAGQQQGGAPGYSAYNPNQGGYRDM